MSCCLFFFLLSEVFEAVFASVWRRIEPGEEIWAGSLSQGWGREEQLGREAACATLVPMALLGLLGPQPAFLGFFFSLWMSWSLKTDIYLHWQHRQNIISRRCDFSSWVGVGVGAGQRVLLGAVLWPWMALDLLGNKWIKGDCHWQSERCLSQTSLG